MSRVPFVRRSRGGTFFPLSRLPASRFFPLFSFPSSNTIVHYHLRCITSLINDVDVFCACACAERRHAS